MADQVNEPSRCSFCGFTSELAGQLLAGNGTDCQAHICTNCVQEAGRVFEQKRRKARTRIQKLGSIPTPQELVRHLDTQVISQASAKRKLAVAINSHAKRLLDVENRLANIELYGEKLPELAEVVIEKSNILLIGPTGCGKTALVKSLAERLDVPLVIGDATTLTESGYVGEDVESLLFRLLEAALWDVSEAETGIIFIDEIDKLRRTTSRSSTRDVSGAGAQQSLLKMIEGHKCNVPAGSRKMPDQPALFMDTSNILFICGGAFIGLEEIIADRLGRSAIGFQNKSKHGDGHSLLHLVMPQDLEEFGLIPELIGRLPLSGGGWRR